MSQTAENIVSLNPNRIYNHILSFIEDKENSSKNTAREYTMDIAQFFRYLRNKEVNQLELHDLKIINSDVLNYRSFLLKTRHYKNTTANRKINTLKSLYRFLNTNEYDVNMNALNVNSLNDDSIPIGFLSPDEVFEMAECAIQYETHNKYMKRALIVLAFATSMRKDALLRLQYNDIRQDKENPDKYIIEPDYLDKGKKIYKEIHKDVYSLLAEAKEKDVRKRTNDKIFTMESKRIGEMMNRLCEHMDIDSRRNISFHSLRKAGAEFVYEITGGDIFAVTAQGNWSNPKTVADKYLKKQANIAGMSAFEKVDDNVFEQLTHVELLAMVKGIGNGTGMKLRSEAQKIVNGRT